MDQLLIPDPICKTTAHEWKKKMITAGSFGEAHPTPISQELERLAYAAARKHFSRVNSFWVGPRALNEFRSGKRRRAHRVRQATPTSRLVPKTVAANRDPAENHNHRATRQSQKEHDLGQPHCNSLRDFLSSASSSSSSRPPPSCFVVIHE